MSEKSESKREQRKGGSDPQGQEGKTSDQPGSGLSRKERKEAEEAVRQRPAVVYETIRIQGENELRRPTSALWWSGIAAGISIGLSFLAQAVLTAEFTAPGWGPVVAKFGYCVGFLIVILGQQQLFTENVLTAVLPVMARKEAKWLKMMLRLWGIVLAANLIGCAIFAFALVHLPIAPSDATPALDEMVATLMAHTPSEIFAKAIGAGWLIAALVWILASTKGSEFLIVTILTYMISVLGFTHIVAGSVEAFYGMFSGKFGLGPSVLNFFVPVLLGNLFGGTLLFSVLSHAQVREEIYETHSK
jgi:formate-nitrite transporter family protein